ncbi:SdiA-regulated domain-containing protein [Candidatus Poribacteria bacterium]
MNINTRRSIYCCLLVSLMTIPAVVIFAAPCDIDDILFDYKWFGNIDKIGFEEPSGIVFHPQRGTLFVVGDLGDICEIQTNGALVKQKHIRDSDFEGVTCDPATGLLYIAIEGEERILEVSPESFEVLREFAIPRTFQGKTVLKAGEQGIEGITFVPDEDHPEGGTFYVNNQSFDPDSMEDPSAIFQIQLPLKSGSGKELEAEIVRYFTPGVVCLSGIHYDSVSQRLYVVSNSTNTFLEITMAGELANFYAFPGSEQEGIAIDEEGYMYIAQDTGGVVKIKWNK